MLSRLFLWIIRVFAIIALVGGIYMAATGQLVPGIIVIVIALGVNASALKKRDKVHAEDRQKCKKCGNSMVGAVYKYKLETKIYTEYGTKYILPTVTAFCPHCGKEKFFTEKICVHTGESIEEMRDDLVRQLDSYYR